MNVYDKNSPCVKCGLAAASAKFFYVAGRDVRGKLMIINAPSEFPIQGDTPHEIVRRTCIRCGFWWDELPQDSKKVWWYCTPAGHPHETEFEARKCNGSHVEMRWACVSGHFHSSEDGMKSCNEAPTNSPPALWFWTCGNMNHKHRIEEEAALCMYRAKWWHDGMKP